MAPAALGHLHGYIYISPAAFPTAGGGSGTEQKASNGTCTAQHGSTVQRHRLQGDHANEPGGEPAAPGWRRGGALMEKLNNAVYLQSMVLAFVSRMRMGADNCACLWK